MDEIKFIEKILEFFNFNISLAKRDTKSKYRLELLISVIPTFKELMRAYKECRPEDNVSKNYSTNLIIYTDHFTTGIGNIQSSDRHYGPVLFRVRVASLQ